LQQVSAAESAEAFASVSVSDGARKLSSPKRVPKSAKFSASRTEEIVGEFGAAGRVEAVGKQKANIEQQTWTTTIESTV
jgi:hypothetical protein